MISLPVTTVHGFPASKVPWLDSSPDPVAFVS